MTPEQKTMAIWSGVICGVLLAGWVVLDIRAENLASVRSKAENLIKRYDQSHPSQGSTAEIVKKSVEEAREQQDGVIAEVEAAFIPALPEQFTNPEISAAEGAIREAINTVEQKAQRQGVKLPELPFKMVGLDPKSETRRLQLAQVYLYCGVLDACIDAGVQAVTAVRLSSTGGIADQTETYGLLTCDIEADSKWKGGTDVLIADLRQRQNNKGYGIRDIEILQNEDGTQRVKLTASLITRYDPGWGLKTEGGVRPTNNAPPTPERRQRRNPNAS